MDETNINSNTTTDPNIPIDSGQGGFFADKKRSFIILAIIGIVIVSIGIYFFVIRSSNVSPTITPDIIKPRQFNRGSMINGGVEGEGKPSASGDFIYADSIASSVIKRNLKTDTFSTLVTNIAGPSEKIARLATSPNQGGAILETEDANGARKKYLLNFSSGSKTQIPNINDLIWKNSDEIIEVFFENNKQKLKIYSLSQNKFIFEADINNLAFDRLLGYDEINRIVYFTTATIPEDFVEGDPLNYNVSIVAISETTGQVVTLKDNIPGFAVAFIDNSVFYDSEDGINKINWLERSGALFYGDVPISFNIEQCDGSKNILYCVSFDGGDVSLVSIDGSTGKLSIINTGRPVFLGKVSIRSQQPLILSIYDQFQNKIGIFGE